MGLFSEGVYSGPGTDSMSGLGEGKESRGNLDVSSVQYTQVMLPLAEMGLARRARSCEKGTR